MRRPATRSLRAGLTALALVAAACGTGGNAKPDRGRALADLIKGAEEVGLFPGQGTLPAGNARLSFGLVTRQGGLVSGGSPQVWIARDTESAPVGPFLATAYRFVERFESNAPRTELVSFYVAEIRVPSPGRWMVAAVASNGARRIAGAAPVEAADPRELPAQVGTKAISVETPVATTEAGRRQICTRRPTDPMHYISLDDALANGQPTVVSFSTPKLCESRVCGPVVDELLAVYEKVGKRRANFIHVEEFLPGRDLRPPPATEDNIAPAFRAWHFESEPWTVVIDATGVIRASFEGPVAAPEIERALQPLLG